MKNNLLQKIQVIFLLILLLNSCTQEKITNFQGGALGTYYSITYMGSENLHLQSEVDSILADISHQFSIFDTTSLIYRINKGEELPLTEDILKVYQISQQVSEATNGAFDITVGPLINVWGFGKEKRSSISKEELDSIMQFVGFTKISLQNNKFVKADPRVQLNFNAIAKGYAVHKVAQFIVQKGYPDSVVDIGGEVVVNGMKNGKQWLVGIQTPTEDAGGAVDAQYAFPLKNRAVATSGNYRSFVEVDGQRYSHIISPQIGKPEHSSLLSVSVIANDCTTADAYATAFMVLGIEKSLEIVKKDPTLAVYFIYDKNGKFEVKKSSNFP